MLIVWQRRAAASAFFRQNKLFALQLFDLLLIAFDESRAFRLHHPIQQQRRLLIDRSDFQLDPGADVLRLGSGLVPPLAEQLGEDVKHLWAGYKLAKHCFICAFDHFPLHRFTEALAPAMAANIIGIGRIPALSPIRRHGVRTASTGQEAPQGEISMDVGAHRSEWLAEQAVLIALKRLQRNQAIMIALPQRHIPHLAFDISGIERVRQDTMRLLVGHMAMPGARKLRMQFEETPHLRLRRETSASKAFQRFGDDGGDWFISNERTAAVWMLLIPIAQRCVVDVEPTQHSCPHPVLGLLPVLLALVLGQACHQIFVEDAVGIGAELPSRRLQRCTRRVDQFLEIKMIADIPRHPAHVIDDDDDFQLSVFADEGQHLIETGATSKFARDVIVEDLDHVMITAKCVLSAADPL